MDIRIKQLEAQRDKLVARLLDGEHKILTASGGEQGNPAWAKAWIELLEEYEQTCAQLAALHKAEVQKAQYQVEFLQQGA